MLDTMTASHAGGIAVLSTHRKFTDRLEFSEEVVTRTMDLAAQKYQNLVVDLPRHAESWSEGVLLGSSQVYVVTDLTIPGLKSARRMIDEISKQFGGEVMARAIVNKYYKPLFSTGLSATEVKKVFGADLAGYVNANDALVREAIDRGVPTTAIKSRNSVITDIRTILGV